MTEPVAPISFEDDGDEIAFGVPFSKINVKDRTVEGYATLDNVDKAFDVVDANASKEAFASWMGNIREMHGPKAVGTAVQISTEKINHKGREYNAVRVKSRISKGAQDTWEKILDGTLKGYSIGGKVLERRPDVVKSDDGNYSEARVNRITKYILAELSVVDNPMNPLAMLDGITKGALIKMEGDELVAGEAVATTQGLFYCDNGCDIAKMDTTDKIEIDCVTCDGQMVRIGEVSETPTKTELKKMVSAHRGGDEIEKVQNYNYETNDGEAGFGVPAAGVVPDMETPNQTLLEQVGEAQGQESDPAPHAEKSVATEPQRIAEAVVEALRGEFTGRSRVDKSEAEQYVSALLDVDMYRATTKAATNGPSDVTKYGDPENLKYPLDTPARVRSAMAYFNASGQRTAGGYSMTKWASIGRRIASAANSSLGEGHSYVGGRVDGPGLSKADAERGEFVINLQKNASDANNNVVNLLQTLVGKVDDDPTITKGGDTTTLDNTKELIEKVLDVLETATREIGEVAKGFSVENLNSENASGPSVGGNDSDAGVGTDDANDGAQTWATAEVEVATATSQATPDNGPEKVVPNAISTDGTGTGQGITADSGPEKVLPHADLTSTSATTKAEEVEETKETTNEDLLKAVLTKVEEGFTTLDSRLTAVETSGGGKKSVEVGDETIQKSDNTPLWGGIFSADELTSND